MKIPRSKWKWFGMPLHFVCAKDCLWHKATLIGDYVVSSVGHMKDPLSDNPEYEIGHNRKYETMVFKADDTKEGCSCPDIIPTELWAEGSNEHSVADQIHDKICLRVARGEIPSKVEE